MRRIRALLRKDLAELRQSPGIFVPAILARLRGRRAAAPFFDAGGQPVREPQVVSREQREALQRG